MSEYDPNSFNAVLSRIHAELADIRNTQESNASKLDSALQRIATLESWKIWVYGVAVGISFVVTSVFALLKWLFFTKA